MREYLVLFLYLFLCLLSLSAHAMSVRRLSSRFVSKSSIYGYSNMYAPLHARLEDVELPHEAYKEGSTEVYRGGNPLMKLLYFVRFMWENDGESKIDKKNSAKIFKDMYSVAIPALAACIVEPLLTIVDSFCIGKFMSTIDATHGLAGMSVNGAIFNILAAATYPLCTATTQMVSDTMGKLDNNYNSRDTDTLNRTNKQELRSIFINGILLASMGGTIVAFLIQILSKVIMNLCFPDLEQAVVEQALSYLRIRSLAIPAVLINDVVVGFSLGCQNGFAPMLSISLTCLGNVIGDLILVGWFRLGLRGAAIATMISSYFGSIAALIYIAREYDLASADNDHADNKYNKKPLLSLCSIVTFIQGFQRHFSLSLMRSFFTASGSIFVGSMLETITYSTGTRIASFAGGKTGQIISNAALANEKLLASAASTIDVAAHQIVMQTWWLLSYMSSPLALIGQALIPRDLAAGRGNKVRYVIMLLSRFGLAIGTICALLCAVFSYALPNTFTNNIVIQAAVQKVTIPVAISQFLICIATTFDGISIGSNAMSDYVWAGIVSTGSAWLFYFFSMQYKLGLMGAWIGLSIFSFTRLLYYIHRFPVVMQSTYKKPSGGSPASDSDYSPLMSHV